MNIGIIGGADGPTILFLSSDISWYAVTIITIICVAVVGIIICSIRKRKNKH